MVRHTSKPESEWDEQARGEMQALLLLEADDCPRCGGSLTETTAPETDDAYIVTARRCHRCTSIADYAATFRENMHPQALLFHAHLEHD